MYGLRYIAIEGSNRRERHFNEPMPARPFHELSDSVCIIDVHDHVQALSTGNPYDLAELGRASERMV